MSSCEEKSLLKIELSHTDGEPRVSISARRSEDKDEMASIFSRLSSGELDGYTIVNNKIFTLRNIEKIRCVVTQASRDPTIAFRLIKTKTKVTLAEWTLSKEGWLDCYLLIREIDDASHQYLTTSGVDDALVVFSYIEE